MLSLEELTDLLFEIEEEGDIGEFHGGSLPPLTPRRITFQADNVQLKRRDALRQMVPIRSQGLHFLVHRLQLGFDHCDGYLEPRITPDGCTQCSYAGNDVGFHITGPTQP